MQKRIILTPIHPASEISITIQPTPYQHIHPGMSRGNRDESPQGLIISLRNATCLPHLEGAVACVLRWVGGGREQGSVRVFGAGDLDQEGSISLTLTCDIDRPSDLRRTILPCPWINNMGEWSIAQSDLPSLLVHPSGEGASVGGVHRISGTGGRGPQLGYGGRVHDIHMLPW